MCMGTQQERWSDYRTGSIHSSKFSMANSKTHTFSTWSFWWVVSGTRRSCQVRGRSDNDTGLQGLYGWVEGFQDREATHILPGQQFMDWTVFKLYPKDLNCQPDKSRLQCNMRGNVSTYDLDAKGVASMVQGNLMPRRSRDTYQCEVQQWWQITHQWRWYQKYHSLHHFVRCKKAREEFQHICSTCSRICLPSWPSQRGIFGQCTGRATLLLFQIVQSINREQELATPMVISYLMGWGDVLRSNSYSVI